MIDPTKLLEQVARLRKEQEQKQRQLEQEKGVLSQLIKDLERHFGTQNVTKAKRLQRQSERELEKLVSKFNRLKAQISKEIDNDK